MIGTDQIAPQVRVCIGCAEPWFSAAHCSLDPADCVSCGGPLVETLSAALAAIRHGDGGEISLQS